MLEKLKINTKPRFFFDVTEELEENYKWNNFLNFTGHHFVSHMKVYKDLNKMILPSRNLCKVPTWQWYLIFTCGAFKDQK